MAALSKEEYLKRYLSNSDPDVKKKRKNKVKAHVKHGKSLIIDDDVNLNDIKATSHDNETQEKLLEIAEDNPLIFDEGGTTVLSKDLETIKKNEEAQKAMWAPVRSVSNGDIGADLPNFESQVGGNEHKMSDNTLGRRRQRHDSSSPEMTRTNRKSPDLSPPRRSGSPLNSQTHLKADSSDDQSPPRRRTRHDSSSNVSPRITRNELSSDLSPARKSQQSTLERRTLKRRHNSPDVLPKRKNIVNRRNVEGHSPQRRRADTREGSPDLSLSRKTMHTRNVVSPDQSPPRQGRAATPPRQKTNNENKNARMRNDTPDQSPPQRRGRVATPPDQSSPRQTSSNNKKKDRVRNDTPDISPPRGMATTHDLSPPRRSRDGKHERTRHDTPNQSPPRQGRSRDSPKRRTIAPDLSPKRKEPRKQEQKAGLHSAAELKRENELSKRREDEMFSRMASSGKGAETVHRDKEGRKRDLKIEKAAKKEEERKKLEEDEKFMEWGKGLQQTKNAKTKVDEEMYEMSKPLARYKDDEDLEIMLREKDRSGDPMLAFLQQKKTKQDVLSGKKEKPKYKGPPAPPTRFDIPPGYRWDGVDRSNGFEKKRFSMLANKGATQDEAYKWSTEDM